MSRRLLPIGYLLLVLGILGIGYGLIRDVSPEGEFTSRDLYPASCTGDNGFYRLFALTEPPEVDIQSPEIQVKYRRLIQRIAEDSSDGAGLGEVVAENDKTFWARKIRKGIPFYTQQLFLIGNRQQLLANRQFVEQKINEYQVLLDRFEQLIYHDQVEDCLPVSHRWVWPPDMVITGYLPRLYCAANLLAALDTGNYHRSTANIIQYCRFTRMLMQTGRGDYTVFFMSHLLNWLDFLNRLIIHPDTPPEVGGMVLERLPLLTREDVAQKNHVIYSYLREQEQIHSFSPGLLFARKRVMQMKLFVQRATLESRRDYPWQNRPVLAAIAGEASKLEEILRNRPRMANHIFQGQLHPNRLLYPFRLVAASRMLKIVAEYRLKADPAQSARENFRRVESYWNLPDPFTGKPFRINEEKGWIYSPGQNFIDDTMEENPLVRRLDVIMVYQ